MGTPAATVGDQVLGSCMHTYQSTSPSAAGPVPSPVPMTLPFMGQIVGPGASTVTIGGKPASLVGDNVSNTAIHPPVGGASIPGPAQPAATNKTTIDDGSPTVTICGKAAVRTLSKGKIDCGLTAAPIVMGTAATVLIA